MEPSISIPTWAQGRPGRGQGGFSAARFAAAVGQPVAIDLRAPIPLDAPLEVASVGDGWELRHGVTTIMRAAPRSPGGLPQTGAVGVAEAAAAMAGFPGTDGDHEASGCFSCGLGERTMRVWPGPLADGSGRTATRWSPPEWVGDADGRVDDAMAWTALDCVQGFFVNFGAGPRRNSLTVRFEAEVYRPVTVGAEYAIVGFDGHGRGWEGRKRMAAANIFDAEGRLVAGAASLWVEPRPG